jgi:hypothetical protein
MEQRHGRSRKHLRRQRQQSLCFPCTRRIAYAYSYRDCNCNCNCDANFNCATKSDADGDCHCDANWNCTTKSDADGDCHLNCNAAVIPFSNNHRLANTDPDGNSYCDSDAYSQADA